MRCFGRFAFSLLERLPRSWEPPQRTHAVGYKTPTPQGPPCPTHEHQHTDQTGNTHKQRRAYEHTYSRCGQANRISYQVRNVAKIETSNTTIRTLTPGMAHSPESFLLMDTNCSTGSLVTGWDTCCPAGSLFHLEDTTTTIHTLYEVYGFYAFNFKGITYWNKLVSHPIVW